MRRDEAQAMTPDLLRSEIARLTAVKADIEEQIAYAKRTARFKNEYADPDWLGRAELAAKLTGRDIRILMDELGSQNQAERQARQAQQQARFEASFISVAKMLLDEAIFNQIKTAAAIATGDAS